MNTVQGGNEGKMAGGWVWFGEKEVGGRRAVVWVGYGCVWVVGGGGPSASREQSTPAL